ncbi:hypothetical protein pb186bvf_002614 [Paramecium bursaria]
MTQLEPFIGGPDVYGVKGICLPSSPPGIRSSDDHPPSWIVVIRQTSIAR